MNIRAKLTLQFVLIVASIVAMFTIGVYFSSKEYRRIDYQARLEQKANSSAKLFFEINEVDSSLLQIINQNLLNLYHDQVVIFSTYGKTIYSFSNWKRDYTIESGMIYKLREENKVHFINDQRDYVGVIYTYNNETYYVFASSYDFYGWDKLYNLRDILVISFIISLIITLFFGLYFSRKALNPITKVINEVNAISETSLYLRVSEGNRIDEISRLAITFNKMLDRLESAFKLQKSFISNAAHELRTPITILLGEIELASMKNDLPEETQTVYQRITDELKRLMSLTKNLLQLAAVNSSDRAVQFEKVRMDELILESRMAVTTKYPNYKVSIGFENLPENEEDIVMNGNFALLRAAFENLIINGCKYSETPKVSISLSVSSTDFVILIRDWGIGISDKDLPAIFEPFYRGNNVSKKEGSGLGLALVKRILDIHQGSIDAIKNSDVGTTFIVKFPKTKF